MYRSARRERDRLAPELAAFTRELMDLPSVSLSERRIADRVEARLRELEYDLVLRDNAGNVVGVIAGVDNGPAVLLNSHMDTASPWDRETSSETALSAPLRDGPRSGRGASECMGGLAAQIYAGALLSRCELPLNGDLVVAATVAEEKGCSVGLRHLLEETLPRLEIAPSFAILGEPTGLDLCRGQDGWVDVDIRVHGQDPRTVRRAGERLAKRLEQFTRKVHAAGGRVIMPTSGAQYAEDDDGPASTIRITRRLTPAEPAERFMGWVRGRMSELLTAFASIEVDIGVHHEQQRLYTGRLVDVEFLAAPWTTDLDHPFVNRARDALLIAGWNHVPVRTWLLNSTDMGTAGGVLMNHYHIPTVGFGPGDESQNPARHETVNGDGLAAAAYGTAVMTHWLIGKPLSW